MTTTILQPKVNVQIVPSSAIVSNTGQKILFVGQVTTGTAVAGELQVSIANGGAEDGLFGEDSMLATMIRFNKRRNQQVQIDAIGLDDNGGTTAATGKVIVVGTATEGGSIEVIVGSERFNKYTIAVLEAETAEDIGDKIAAAINDDPTNQCTALNAVGDVSLEAKNGGTVGNNIPLSLSGIVAGLTLTVTGMLGGVVDPVLTGVFDVIGSNRYQAILWPWSDDLTELTGLLDPRFNADGIVLDGVGFTGALDTKANLEALAISENSQSLVIFGSLLTTEVAYVGGAVVEQPIMWASQFAGYRALRLDTDGFAVSDLVLTSQGPLDAFGGPALASKPYFNTPFADLVEVQPQRGFDDQEIEDLHDVGITVIGNNTANNGIIAGEVVTTYKTDTAGNPDITFKYLNYVDTATQSREYFYNNYRKRFAQSRLTEGDVIKGRDMANAGVIRSYSKRLYQDLSGVDFVLLESGEDALKFFDENLIITIDKAIGRASIQMTVIIVTQLREIAATMKIAFSTQP